MLTKRIIPCLDVKDGRVVKGINFVQLRDAGDPVELAQIYSTSGADELVFLDIAATEENRVTLIDLVKRVSENVFIPFTVGGGIKSAEGAELIIKNGADKISLNSSAVVNPNLISEIAKNLGRQAVVVAIDVGEDDLVYVSGGKKRTGINYLEWAMRAEELGAGEILLTSIGRDGSKLGYDLTRLQQLSGRLDIPVIASGGAGSKDHFRELFLSTGVDAALAASLFHYGELSISELKSYLGKADISIRL